MAQFSQNDFDVSQDKLDRLDSRLLRGGAVKLYFNSRFLEEDCQWLREHGYDVEAIDCGGIDGFLSQMSVVLRFKENFGYDGWNGNLDALNDAFWALQIDPDGGTVLCFQRYSNIAAADRDFAQSVLDIIECNSREFLLSGRRLLALVQTNDPKTRFEPVGARPVLWNQREWFDSARGL